MPELDLGPDDTLPEINDNINYQNSIWIGNTAK